MAIEDHKSDFDLQELRRRAIERLQRRHGTVADMPAGDVEKLVHELEVYQVELEVQNEELRRAQSELAHALERYRDLYHRAPVGYLTLDADGNILQANQAAAMICSRDRDELEGQRLERIALRKDRDRVWLLLRSAAATGLPQACDFRVERPTGPPRWAHVDILRLDHSQEAPGGFRLTLTDITARVQAEEALLERQAAALKLMEEAVEARNELERRVQERTKKLAAANEALEQEVRERRAAEERVRSLLRQLVTVQEEERRRIARELHDTLGQQITALKLGFGIFMSNPEGHEGLREEAGRMQRIFDKLDSDVDFLAWELRPAVLDELGIDAAFGSFIREWAAHLRLDAEYQSFGLESERLSPEVETNLYRILQEALQNVYKHAKAAHVSVTLHRQASHVALAVEDDGQGFDADRMAPAVASKVMGLVNMRERAAIVGGSLEIESAPGGGTTILVRVPLARPDGDGIE